LALMASSMSKVSLVWLGSTLEYVSLTEVM
jgi:hypothetical protein